MSYTDDWTPYSRQVYAEGGSQSNAFFYVDDIYSNVNENYYGATGINFFENAYFKGTATNTETGEIRQISAVAPFVYEGAGRRGTFDFGKFGLTNGYWDLVGNMFWDTVKSEVPQVTEAIQIGTRTPGIITIPSGEVADKPFTNSPQETEKTTSVSNGISPWIIGLGAVLLSKVIK